MPRADTTMTGNRRMCPCCERALAPQARICPHCSSELQAGRPPKIRRSMPLSPLQFSAAVLGIPTVLVLAAWLAATPTHGNPGVTVRPEDVARAYAQAGRPPPPGAAAGAGVSIADWSWSKGGFDAVMIADFTFRNDNPFPVKDLTVRCIHSAPSGTEIDRNTRVIYEIVPAHGTKLVPHFSMGFIASQATSSRCSVIDFK